MKIPSFFGLAACVLLAAPPPAIAGALPRSGYHLLRTIHLPGNGGWDYCIADSPGRRLYVTHGDRVDVLDLDRDVLVGTIGPFQGIHGVALARALGRGYVSDGKAGAVICFDLKTRKIIQSIPGRPDADGIIYDPASRQVFAFNGDDKSATVIDALTNSVTATLALGGKPEFSAADGKGLVFVNLVDLDEVLTINAQQHTIIRTSDVAPGDHPSAMSIDRDDGNLFSGCRNKQAVVLDPSSGEVKGLYPIGDHVDASVYDRGMRTVFFSCGDGTIWAFYKGGDGKFYGMAPIRTKKGSRTMAVDFKTHDLYLPSADFGPAPAPSAADPHPRPKLRPGTFAVLVYGRN
ncbi:MAG TPA: YncE family protein [bacterium]|jgi:YVTN family beta-propeller protein|nr:YncE family protein [bacterium]